MDEKREWIKRKKRNRFFSCSSPSSSASRAGRNERESKPKLFFSSLHSMTSSPATARWQF